MLRQGNGRNENAETNLVPLRADKDYATGIGNPEVINSSDESQILDSSDERVLDTQPLMSFDTIVGSPDEQPAQMQPRRVNFNNHDFNLSEHRVARDRAEELVRQAEERKAEILRPTGESLNSNLPAINPCREVTRYLAPLAQNEHRSENRVPQTVSNDLSCDHEHYMLSAHIDKLTTQKIQRGKYVQIEKLISRTDRGLSCIEDNRLEMVSRNGQTYLVPAEDRNQGEITNFRQWERAFRIYAGIYARANPNRAAEMYQFVSNIQAASNVYIWDNVASYDRIFRTLMHDSPGRNWGLIFQQAWSLELRTPLPFLQSNNGNRRGSNHSQSQRALKET